MFKSNWEKSKASDLRSKDMVEKMVRLVYPHKKLISQESIAGGCANLNFKIQLDNENNSLILRIYWRDKDAVYREQKLATLLQKTIPIPQTYAVGELEGYHFAMTEFMPGISLRNFNKELEVTPCTSFDGIKFAQNCLINKNISAVLSHKTISEIRKALNYNGDLLPDSSEKYLVHGDFDPANILVDKRNGIWSISAILDWEFAFSGSPLWDVATMLRYAHKMPTEFQNAFLQGLTDSGFALPKNWRIITDILNVISLLDCLQRSDPEKHPNRCTDSRELIQHLMKKIPPQI